MSTERDSQHPIVNNAPAPMRKASVSIRDVAVVAGVSVGTVSRALNRTGRVSERTIASVTEVANRLGYEPDSVAQSMRTKSTRVVGLLISDFANPLYAPIITAVEDRLQVAGFALLLANTQNNARRERALVDLFRRRRVDGLILGPCEMESREFLEHLAKELPVVALDRDFSPSGSGAVVDHFRGALEATRHLLNLGHERIALLTPGSALRPGRDRIAGFRAAFEERGLTPNADLICAEQSAMAFSFSEALALLSSDVAPTAFMCLGTRILSGVLQALRHSDRVLPDDVSVMNIGDTDLSQLFSPSLTTVTWDYEALGSAAAELVLRQLEGEHDIEPKRIDIPMQIVVRQSCGPVTALAFQATR